MNTPEFRLTFEAAWSRGEGREITGVAAPYNVPATIMSRDNQPLRVMLAPGTFRRAVRAPMRVELRFEHADDNNILGVVGNGVRLNESVTGLEGTFRAFPSPVGDQALAMIEAGVARGLSVGFYQKAAHHDADGTLVVTTGHLVEVSLCREPAFAGAGVLRVASAAELRVPRASDLDDRLRAAGFLA